MGFKQNKYFYLITPKLTVKRIRNAPIAIALESHPSPRTTSQGYHNQAHGRSVSEFYHTRQALIASRTMTRDP